MSSILGTPLDDLRRDRTSIKWTVFGPDVLPLWVAEMDAAPCPAVVDAVTAAMERADTGYPNAGPYADAVAGFARDTWNWDIDVESTKLVTDVMIGVSELLRVLTDPGGPVIVSPPCYDSFFGFITAIGREVIEAPLDAAGRLDLAALADAFGSATANGTRAAYLLCNPQNPTGVAHRADELSALGDLAREYGVSVVADEIHAPLVYAEAEFVPATTVIPEAVSVVSASKAWNLAGLKAALLVPGSASVDLVRKLHEVHTHGAGHVGAIAQAAALNEGRDWLAQLTTELDANRRLLAQLLAEHLPQVGYRMPEATYLAWLDCRDLGLGDRPSDHFLQKARVALSVGPNYGSTGAGFARLNLATSPEIITEAIGRIANSLE